MYNRLLLDTSILQELFLKESNLHPSLFDGYELVINNYIFAEFMVRLYENYTTENTIRARNMLLSSPAVKITHLTENYFHFAIQIMNKLKRYSLSLIDCLILAHAKLDSLTLATKKLNMKKYKLVKHW